MSRIFFENEYVIVVPSFEDVAPHKHSFCHIFFLGTDVECDEIYVTGSGMLHTMPKREECKLFLMIDPTSDLADYIQSNLLDGDKPKRMKTAKAFRYEEDADEEFLKDSMNNWLTENSFQFGKEVNESIRTLEYMIRRMKC